MGNSFGAQTSDNQEEEPEVEEDPNWLSFRGAADPTPPPGGRKAVAKDIQSGHAPADEMEITPRSRQRRQRKSRREKATTAPTPNGSLDTSAAIITPSRHVGQPEDVPLHEVVVEVPATNWKAKSSNAQTGKSKKARRRSKADLKPERSTVPDSVEASSNADFYARSSPRAISPEQVGVYPPSDTGSERSPRTCVGNVKPETAGVHNLQGDINSVHASVNEGQQHQLINKSGKRRKRPSRRRSRNNHGSILQSEATPTTESANREQTLTQGQELVDRPNDERVHNTSSNTEPETNANEALKRLAQRSEAVESPDDRRNSSDHHTSSPNNGFDEQEKSSPREIDVTPTSGLKRKRGIVRNILATPQSFKSGSSQKRRRRDVFSPTTSGASDKENASDKDLIGRADDEHHVTQPTAEHWTSSQPTLRNWAKSLKDAPHLRHPIHHPESPKSHRPKDDIVIAIQRRKPNGAGSSASVTKEARGKPQQMTAHNNDGMAKTHHAIRKSAKAPYTVKNGKAKAHPEVEHFTPKPQRTQYTRSTSESQDESDNDEVSATTIAKRTFPSSKRSSIKKSIRSGSMSSPDARPREGTSDSETSTEWSKPLSATSSEPEDDRDATSDPPTDNEKVFKCKTCQKRFSQQRYLHYHQKRKGIHDNLFTCLGCGKGFYSGAALATHKEVAPHGCGAGLDGRTGKFTKVEINKIDRYRERYCDDYDVTIEQFNERMAQTLARYDPWPFDEMPRNEFLEGYFNVLPNRNKRSMQRFRSEYFANVIKSQEWVYDDDELLEELVNELGHRWKEIADRMIRSVEDVRRRWKLYVKYRQKRQTGDWTPAELEELRGAVAKVLKRSVNAVAVGGEYDISWQAVSDTMGNARTPVQCSDHWKAHRQAKMMGRTPRLKSSKPPRDRRPKSTKDGQPSKKKKEMSDKYVHESDLTSGDEHADANEPQIGIQVGGGSQTPIPNQHRSQQPVKITSAAEAVVDSPGLPANRLHKTPRKGMSLSQAFGDTQANTSALRKQVQGTGRSSQLRHPEIPDRPSPQLSLRLQPVSEDEDDQMSMIAPERTESDDDSVSVPSSSDQSDSASRQLTGETRLSTQIPKEDPLPAPFESTSSSGSSSPSASASESDSEAKTSENESLNGEDNGDTDDDEGRDSMERETHNDFMQNIRAVVQKKRKQYETPSKSHGFMAINHSQGRASGQRATRGDTSESAGDGRNARDGIGTDSDDKL